MYRKIICIIVLSLFISFGTAVRSTNLAYAGQVNEMSAQELYASIRSSKDLVIIDTSPSGSFREGHIESSLIGDARKLKSSPEEYLNSLGIGKSENIILVCPSGKKSYKVAEVLISHGFQNTYNLSGGKIAWVRSGYELVPGGDDN